MIYFSVYLEDFEQVKDTVTCLKQIGYGNIVVRFDGRFNSKIAKFLRNEKVTVKYTHNIKQQVGGGANTQHYLGLFLNESDDEYLIKIDPDTLPCAKLRVYPNKQMLGANFNHTIGVVYGGCLVFSRLVARQIHQSKLLLEDNYKKDKWFYTNKRLDKKIPCNDKIIYDVVKRLNIEIDPMEEQINCTGKITYVKNQCFIHPKKIARFSV